MAQLNPKGSEPMSVVEVSVSCKNLKDKDVFSKSDPMCVLSMKDFGSAVFKEIGRTEQVKNSLNPEFSHKFMLDYYFEQSQKLKFELYDVDSPRSALDAHDFLGRIEVTLGEIVGAPGSKIHKQLCDSRGITGKSGTTVVSAELVEGSKEGVVMQWKGVKLDKKDFFGKSDPFLMFYKVNDDNSSKLIVRSEFCKHTLNPTWKPFKTTARQLCSDNHERKIRIECFDYDEDGGHDLIGSCETTYAQLHAGPGSQNVYDLINPKKKAKKGSKYKNSGQIHLISFNTFTEHSFLDFIRGGTQLHFTVAVDFTASNGNPVQPNSLHHIHPYQPNQYMMALKAVGDIVQDYDSDKMFPALGFGGKLPNGKVSHEFFMNFSPSDPHCHGVDGILQAYRKSLLSVTLYGPTNFSPVINHVAKFAAGAPQDGTNYFVLLIITDGVITDFEQTKQAIVMASGLPLSIIIVGVGSAEFDAMDALDADNQRLSAGGRYAERDIVQFVPFRDYMTQGNVDLSQARLAKDVLFEVPTQLTGWMQARKIDPRPPQQVNLDQLPAQAPPPQHVQDGVGYNLPPLDQQQGQAPPYQQQPPPPQQTAPIYAQQGQQFHPQQQPPFPNMGYGNPQQPGGVPPYPQQGAGAPPYPQGPTPGAPAYPGGGQYPQQNPYQR